MDEIDGYILKDKTKNCYLVILNNSQSLERKLLPLTFSRASPLRPIYETEKKIANKIDQERYNFLSSIELDELKEKIFSDEKNLRKIEKEISGKINKRLIFEYNRYFELIHYLK